MLPTEGYFECVPISRRFTTVKRLLVRALIAPQEPGEEAGAKVQNGLAEADSQGLPGPATKVILKPTDCAPAHSNIAGCVPALVALGGLPGHRLVTYIALGDGTWLSRRVFWHKILHISDRSLLVLYVKCKDYLSASNPGKVPLARKSNIAPPAVDMKVNLSSSLSVAMAAIVSPPPTTVVAPRCVASPIIFAISNVGPL